MEKKGEAAGFRKKEKHVKNKKKLILKFELVYWPSKSRVNGYWLRVVVTYSGRKIKRERK